MRIGGSDARGPRRRARGYILLWAVAMLAILAALAAVTAPYLTTATDAARVERSAAILASIAEAVDSFNLVVKRGGASFTTPNNLTQLTSTIANGDQAGCTSQTYNTTAVTNWRNNAPFGGGIAIDASGVWTPLGRINVDPSRTPNTVGTARTSTSDPYYVQMEDVDIALARGLDLYVDGTESRTAGVVRYTAPAADSTTVVSYDVTLAHTPAC